MKLRRVLRYALFLTFLYALVLWAISLFGVNLVTSKNFWSFLPLEFFNLNISRWYDLLAFFVVIFYLYFVVHMTKLVKGVQKQKIIFLKCLLISLYFSLFFVLFFGFWHGFVFSLVIGLGGFFILTILVCILFFLGFISIFLGKIIWSILYFLGKVVYIILYLSWNVLGSILRVGEGLEIEK